MNKLITLALCTFCACTSFTPPRTYDVQNSKVFNGPLEKVWSATIASLGQRGIIVNNLDKQNGLITTNPWVNPSWTGAQNPDADCGELSRPGLGTFRLRLTVTFNLLLKPVDSSRSSVKIVSLFVGTYSSVDAFGAVYDDVRTLNCSSKGALEKELFDAIQSQL